MANLYYSSKIFHKEDLLNVEEMVINLQFGVKLRIKQHDGMIEFTVLSVDNKVGKEFNNLCDKAKEKSKSTVEKIKSDPKMKKWISGLNLEDGETKEEIKSTFKDIMEKADEVCKEKKKDWGRFVNEKMPIESVVKDSVLDEASNKSSDKKQQKDIYEEFTTACASLTKEEFLDATSAANEVLDTNENMGLLQELICSSTEFEELLSGISHLIMLNSVEKIEASKANEIALKVVTNLNVAAEKKSFENKSWKK